MNGEETGSFGPRTGDTLPAADSDHELVLGATSTEQEGGQFGTATLDGLLIYDRALTAQQVQAEYSATNTP